MNIIDPRKLARLPIESTPTLSSCEWKIRWTRWAGPSRWRAPLTRGKGSVRSTKYKVDLVNLGLNIYRFMNDYCIFATARADVDFLFWRGWRFISFLSIKISYVYSVHYPSNFASITLRSTEAYFGCFSDITGYLHAIASTNSLSKCKVIPVCIEASFLWNNRRSSLRLLAFEISTIVACMVKAINE